MLADAFTPPELTMYKPQKLALSCLLGALCASASFAMEAPIADSAGQPIEEITVTGQRSLFELRMQVSAAEDAMYALFNELNSDDQYDIVCTVEIRYFSHLKQKQCVPQYASAALMNEVQDAMRGVPGMPAAALLARHEPRLEAKFQELVGQNHELFQAVARHYELNEIWRARRRTHFGDDE